MGPRRRTCQVRVALLSRAPEYSVHTVVPVCIARPSPPRMGRGRRAVVYYLTLLACPLKRLPAGSRQDGRLYPGCYAGLAGPAGGTAFPHWRRQLNLSKPKIATPVHVCTVPGRIGTNCVGGRAGSSFSSASCSSHARAIWPSNRE